MAKMKYTRTHAARQREYRSMARKTLQTNKSGFREKNEMRFTAITHSMGSDVSGEVTTAAAARVDGEIETQNRGEDASLLRNNII